MGRSVGWRWTVELSVSGQHWSLQRGWAGLCPLSATDLGRGSGRGVLEGTVGGGQQEGLPSGGGNFSGGAECPEESWLESTHLGDGSTLGQGAADPGPWLPSRPTRQETYRAMVL